MQKTKVTIGITTYNLEQYIKQCLDSILCQETDFTYKILVVDDASTDGTRDILKEYKEKFPQKIELILKEKNGGYLESSNMLFNQIKTEYFSFIDGDDYWLTTTRLQKAIDFLDKNPSFTMYGSNSYYLRDNKIDGTIISEQNLEKSYRFEDYIKEQCPFVHTSSIVLRNVVYNKGMPQIYIDNERTIYNCAFRGEDIRFIEHLRKGKLFVSKDITSVYRIHSKGIWQGSSQNKQLLETCLSSLKYQELFPEAKKRYVKGLKKSYQKVVFSILSGYNFNKTEHKLFVGLLNELNEKNYSAWCLKPVKHVKLKNKIMRNVFKVIEKIS